MRSLPRRRTGWLSVLGAPLTTREVVEWRLAAYLDRGRFRVRVSHTRGRPILLGLDREKHPHYPEGDVSVWVDGEQLTLRFAKIAINVAYRTGESENLLPGILRRWFGADAGAPGTRQSVQFTKVAEGWKMEPFSVSSRPTPKE